MPPKAFEFVDAIQADHTVKKMCEVLEVSRSDYYEWKTRAPSQRQRDDDTLVEVMLEAWHD